MTIELVFPFPLPSTSFPPFSFPRLVLEPFSKIVLLESLWSFDVVHHHDYRRSVSISLSFFFSIVFSILISICSTSTRIFSYLFVHPWSSSILRSLLTVTKSHNNLLNHFPLFPSFLVRIEWKARIGSFRITGPSSTERMKNLSRYRSGNYRIVTPRTDTYGLLILMNGLS